jgi:hypothetical protein
VPPINCDMEAVGGLSFCADQQPKRKLAMRAIGYYRPLPIDNADALVDLDLPAPALRPRDLLVR